MHPPDKYPCGLLLTYPHPKIILNDHVAFSTLSDAP